MFLSAGSALGLLTVESAAAGSAASSSPSAVEDAGKLSIHVGGTFRGAGRWDASRSTVEARGRAIVRAHGSVAASAALVTSGVDRFGDGQTVVRFAQSHRGLPIIGRGAVVRLSPTGQPMTTVLDLASDLPSRIDASVAPVAAASAASARLGVGAEPRDAHLVIWPTLDRGARLAYAVVPRIPVGVPTAPRAIVDAETGEVIEARDTIVFAKARIYATNPIMSPELVLAELALTPSGPGLSNDLLESSNCIDRKSVKSASVFGLWPMT